MKAPRTGFRRAGSGKIPYHYDVLAGLEGGDINERFNEAVGEVLDMAI